jgi:N-acetylmuramoyl-L-alanine amidase
MRCGGMGWLLLLAGCRGPTAVPPLGSGSEVSRVDAAAARDAMVTDAMPAALLAPEPIISSPAVSSPVIVDWPISWGEQREALTLDYRRRHHSEHAADLTIEPRVIVLHYTGSGSAKGTKAYFDRLLMEGDRKQLAAAGKVNVSSHFLVDRDGTIYRLQPETRFARHCIGLNHLAIGIENVGDEDRWPLTELQIAADAALVRDLAHRFPITHLLGHHEVMRFRAHPYYQELDPTYRNTKLDPGARFLAAVRAAVSDLGLAGR